ncbi:4Fe-4S dicluster domain-containing protein [Planctomycetota bacterium]
MSEKLIIDLATCVLQERSGVLCSYKHHPENQGINALLEMIRFGLVCRRCEAAPCVQACPQEALTKLPSKNGDAGKLQRANMLCTGCGTCALACPFGTIYPELIPYPSSVCDLCRGRLSTEEKPLCVQTCTDNSIDYAEATSTEDMIEVFPDIVVRVTDGSTWQPEVRIKV